MRRLTLVSLLALFALPLCAVTVLASDFTGTWRLDLAKSKPSTDLASQTMKIEQTGPNVFRTTIDGVLNSGKKEHQEVNRICDGKEHATTGVGFKQEGATEICEQMGSNRKVTQKRDGKVVSEFTSTVSPDGKVMTNVRKGGGDERLVFDKQDDTFSGTWKANEAKTKFGSNVDLRFRVNDKGELEELRGPESRPVVQPVRFDGKAYAVDGGNMIEWKQIDAHDFQRKIFDGRTSHGKEGKLLATRNLHIPPDNKSLTEETERVLTNGKPSLTTITYTRTSGEPKDLTGTWKPITIHSDSPTVLTLAPAGNNALKWSSDRDLSYILTFDGNDAPIVGPNVISKLTVAGKQVDGHTIEVTDSREGVVADKSKWELSLDGKTMTITTTRVGPDASAEPSVEVYDRQ